MRDPSYVVASISGADPATGASRQALPGHVLSFKSERSGLKPLAVSKTLGLREFGSHASGMLPHAVSIYRALGHASGCPRSFNPDRHEPAALPLV